MALALPAEALAEPAAYFLRKKNGCGRQTPAPITAVDKRRSHQCLRKRRSWLVMFSFPLRDSFFRVLVGKHRNPVGRGAKTRCRGLAAPRLLPKPSVTTGDTASETHPIGTDAGVVGVQAVAVGTGPAVATLALATDAASLFFSCAKKQNTFCRSAGIAPKTRPTAFGLGNEASKD